MDWHYDDDLTQEAQHPPWHFIFQERRNCERVHRFHRRGPESKPPACRVDFESVHCEECYLCFLVHGPAHTEEVRRWNPAWTVKRRHRMDFSTEAHYPVVFASMELVNVVLLWGTISASAYTFVRV